MLDRNKMPKSNKRQEGFSLVELMIAIAIGLLITAAVTAMAVNSLKMNSATLKSARLNQDVGAVMQIMVNEIRRAGYGSKVFHASLESLSVPGDIELIDLDGEPSNGAECILYRYDANDSDDTKDKKGDHTEKRGFRLTGTSIEMATGDANDCDSGDWVSLTDPEVITITKFEIDSGNSKCHNINKNISIQIAPDASATEFACNEIIHDHVKEGGVGDDGKWVWDGISDAEEKLASKGLKEYGKDNPDDLPIRSVGVRHVNISLEAELTRDSSVSKNLDISIKVRNDHPHCIPNDHIDCLK